MCRGEDARHTAVKMQITRSHAKLYIGKSTEERETETYHNGRLYTVDGCSRAHKGERCPSRDIRRAHVGKKETNENGAQESAALKTYFFATHGAIILVYCYGVGARQPSHSQAPARCRFLHSSACKCEKLISSPLFLVGFEILSPVCGYRI